MTPTLQWMNWRSPMCALVGRSFRRCIVYIGHGLFPPTVAVTVGSGTGPSGRCLPETEHDWLDLVEDDQRSSRSETIVNHPEIPFSRCSERARGRNKRNCSEKGPFCACFVPTRVRVGTRASGDETSAIAATSWTKRQNRTNLRNLAQEKIDFHQKNPNLAAN
jgi:hypothetical protein